MKSALRHIVRKIGFDLVSFDPRFNYEARKYEIIKRQNISHILDVGANIGQFGTYMRRMGFNGRITSFEPMSDAYATLRKVIKNDPNWVARQTALGAKDEEIVINISQNSHSSSIKQVLDRHLEAHPDSVIVSHETVQLSTVDTLFKDTIGDDKNIMLKVDTQGFESEVLLGAKNSLDKISLVVLELSLEPLYEGQDLLPSLLSKMMELGFKLVILEPCDEDFNSLTILQMDGWFVKPHPGL